MALEVSMSSRALLWTLGALVVALVFVPLVGMLVTPGGSMNGMMSGGMAMMLVGGLLWLILIVAVIAALVALLVRGETKA